MLCTDSYCYLKDQNPNCTYAQLHSPT